MDKKYCQKTAIVGLGGVGKTQIALEVAYRIHETDPDCSIFWVPAVDSTSFEQAYREIGRKLQIDGIEDDKADVKSLVKAALSRKDAGRWLLVVDNADDLELMFGKKQTEDSVTRSSLARCLPFGRKGSILFTTRNSMVARRLDAKNSISVGSKGTPEAQELLKTNLDGQLVDTGSTARLLDLLANLPLAIKQASAYMIENQISIPKYLEIYETDEDEMIYLLSR